MSTFEANVDVIAHQISTEAISIQNAFDRTLGNVRYDRWDYEEELMREIRLAVYEPTRKETRLAVARCFRFIATEPQTAEYQAAVDNVWFEIERNASSIKSSWNFDLWNTRMDRLDYVTDLEEKIMRALNVLDLAYELSS
jgi:hypothetical protein